MTTLIANDFTNHTLAAITEFIQLQQQTNFEIHFPKNAIAGKDDNFEVFCEYHLAAFAGYKLSQIATSFAYYVPSPRKIGHFKFEVEIRDKRKFAKILFEIITAFFKPTIDDGALVYNVTAAEFSLKAYDEWEDIVTAGLISIAKQFLAQ